MEVPIGTSTSREEVSLENASDALSVSRRSAARAKAVINRFPEALDYIVSGDITVADAHKVKDESDAIKQEVVARFHHDKEAGRRTKRLAEYRKGLVD